MTRTGIAVRVFDRGAQDPLIQGLVIVVIDYDAGTYLAGDGSWQSLKEGTVPAGFVLPHEAAGPLADALAAYQGKAGNAATEASVLREWLAVEMKRVNDTLESRR